MKRPEINITPSERAGRVVLGGAAAIVGLVLLASAAGTLAVVLEALLVLAGLDLVVTGARALPALPQAWPRAAITEEASMNKLETDHTNRGHQHGGHSGHGWMMMICCIPMLVIAIALVATGVASASFIFAAVACTAMMFMMMRMMGGMGGGGEQR